LTHQHVYKPNSRKDLPRIPKIGKCLFCPLRAASKGYASADELNPNPHKEKNMKKTIGRIILVAFLLLASGAAPVLADSTPLPGCYPKPCPPK
jgi:hypothetical protein